MGRYSLVLLTLTSAMLFALPVNDELKVQKAEALSAALVQKLSSELKMQMQNGGPLNALHFCANNALSFTDQIAKESNTSIQRISLKNRNPINAASAEEEAILNRWSSLQNSGSQLPAHEIKQLANGQSAFYKPIVINNEACLKCHGEIASDSPLYKEIKATYPYDKATGYKMGDLRGMIVITLPKEN